MTQLEIYKRQLEIANQLLENAKNNNMSSEDISMYEDLCDLCKRSIEIYESNQEARCELDIEQPHIIIGTKIRSKANPNVILSIISNDCHEDEFECSNGSVLSLNQIEKYYDIII